MNCRKLLLGFALACIAFELPAQDPHFSQFYASPLTLNPALTGKFNGNFRVFGNHRNQWPTINRAYITSTFSVDFPVMQASMAVNDNWGVGIMGYTDKSAGGAVTFNYAAVSTAYHKGLDEEGAHQLSAGFQVTYANMFINTAQLKFEDQLTTSGFTGVTSEVFAGSTLKNNYVDLNAGILYNGSTSDRNNFYAGISLYHITRPQQSFTGANFLLNPRATLHGGAYFPLSSFTNLHLSGLVSKQGETSEGMIGGAVEWMIGADASEDPTSFYIGSWVRFQDAIIPYVGLEFNQMRLGLTYDVTTSTLKTFNQTRGGMEISLVYIYRPSSDRVMKCPKF